jgi:hypothetical protein
MPLNRNWYTLNGTRRYPIDDGATGEGDGGENLPNNLIVDANVRLPSTLGTGVAVSSVIVSKSLVSVTLVAVAHPPVVPAGASAGTATFVPLGAVSVRLPIQQGRPYPINPMTEGVGGWLVFGEGAAKLFSARFSTPQQAGLNPKTCRFYRPLPIPSIAKLNSSVRLDGVVTVKAGPDVEILAADRVIDGQTVNAMVIRLRQNTPQNLFDKYRGPCAGRPESNTCNRPAVEFINTVGPDCNGNLTIKFPSPLRATPINGGGGLVLDYPYGLIDACTRDDRLPNTQGRLPNEYDDECNPSDGDQDANARTGGPLFAPQPDLDSEYPSASSQVLDICADLPHTETFDDRDPDNWQIIYGSWTFVGLDSPEEGYDDTVSSSVAYYSASSSSSWSEVRQYTIPGTDTSWVADEVAGRNMAVWFDCAYEEVYGLRLTTDVMLPANQGRGNAAIVLNLRNRLGGGGGFEYWTVEIDRPNHSLRIRWWTGSSWTTLVSAPLSAIGRLVEWDTWYRLEATVTEISPGTAKIVARLIEIPTLVQLLSINTTTTAFAPGRGKIGIGSEHSRAYFSFFRVEQV